MRPQIRILIAFAIGFLIVGAAFGLAKARPATVPQTVVINDDKPIRKFINVTDSDKNNIPDWQEEFIGETIQLKAEGTEKEAVKPTTAKKLVENLIRSTNSGFSEDILIEQQNQILKESFKFTQYTKADIIITPGEDLASWKKYGQEVAQLLVTRDLPQEFGYESTLLDRVLKYEDKKAAEELTSLVTKYKTLTKDLLEIPVPASLIKEHLSLVNVYQVLTLDIEAFASTSEDAVAMVLHSKTYPVNTKALEVAVANLYRKQYQAGVQWDDDDVVLEIVNFAE